ncbi:MAG: hypothetical protein H6624_19050 [Bdellovibrionaceae bacterium]|nr:hypothetical protein [Bdellovibrionales bacterium]MCB9086446.1 hypothetical protein [Pseudobdellovibrionaceae bacterium]
MVSIAIIGVTALGISRLFISGAAGTKAMNQSSACVNHLNSVINRIRALGTRVNIGDFIPPAGSSPVNRWAVVGGTIQVEQDAATIDPAHRYPPSTAYNITNVPAGPAAPVLVRTPHLIQGIMGGMLAIYNSSTANFCTNVNGSVYSVAGPALSSLFAPASNTQTLINLSTTVRIQPFDLGSGAIVGCPAAPLFIAPRGQPSNMSTAMTTGRGGGLGNGLDNTMAPQGIAWAAGVRNDVGLLVTLRASYEDVNGVALGCTAEMRLQYPEDGGVPGAPTVSIERNSTWDDPGIGLPADQRVGESGAGTGPVTPTSTDVDCSAFNTNTIQLNVGYQDAVNNPNEAGTVLLCRDRSYRLLHPRNDVGYFAACTNAGGAVIAGREQFPPMAYFSGAAPGDQGLPRPQWNPAVPYVNGGFVDVPYLDTAAHPGYFNLAMSNNTWTPCDQAQVCGVAPGLGPATLGAGTKFYSFTWTNLPSGCVMQMDVRSMDTAGNLSPISSVDNTTISSSANIVQYPRCGNWCGTGGGYIGGQAGYFRCGPCP